MEKMDKMDKIGKTDTIVGSRAHLVCHRSTARAAASSRGHVSDGTVPSPHDGASLPAVASRPSLGVARAGRCHGFVARIAVSLLAAIGCAGVRPAGAQTTLHPTADLLRRIIQVDNSNPPGNEEKLAALLSPLFTSLGFEIDIVPTPNAGKTHFIARLRGDGSKRPVLLAAHGDTVGVEREKWSVDPFGGIVKDGHVLGRGAIDFKGGIAVFARAVMMLAERKVPLARDVIFLVEADEEAASYNTTWLARDHWSKIECEFALNEGGWIIKGDDGKVKYVSISTADKSSRQAVVTARGTSTHSSMPLPDNAIFTLSRALAKISAYETPIKLIPISREFFATLAKTSAPPLSDAFRAVSSGTADKATLERADRLISQDPLLHALLRDTLAPVLMKGGFRSNVIPGEAEATINIRMIPGTDPNSVVADMLRVVDDPKVEIKLAATTAVTGIPPSSQDTDLFRALVKHARTQFPGAEVTPYLFQAGTDAGAWRSRGVPVYGIYPYPITAEELTRMHGNDEQVAVDSLVQGTEFIYRTLVEVAGK
jgi:acetylornithine deacetylase/succinyl-diaminopimelate desuccinylase-like protein